MDHFLRARASLLKKSVSGFSAESLRRLEEYSYPGNVLELKHIVEWAVNLCQGERIQVRDLPSYMTNGLEDLSARSAENPTMSSANEPKGDESLDWAAIERKMIVDTLLKTNGRRSKAALVLGWGRSTLWRKMKQYGITSSEDVMDGDR
jgi:DNA-binding NtrC family response regulator